MATHNALPQAATLPDTGFVRVNKIIGQDEVTEEQAERNRKRKKGPKRRRPAITGVIPVKKSTWWAGVNSGRFPKPVKLGPGITAWHVQDIRALIRSLMAS